MTLLIDILMLELLKKSLKKLKFDLEYRSIVIQIVLAF